MRTVRNAGFALIDVLIALLLLAIALLGACAALVQTQRATYGALLLTRAVDLVADLNEELQCVNSVTQQRELVAAWRQRVIAEMPMRGVPDEQGITWASATGSSGATLLTLRWRATDSGSLRELSLPLSARLEPAS